MRLLICDDHAVFADSLAHLLSANGKEVVAVTYTVEQLIELMAWRLLDLSAADSDHRVDALGPRLRQGLAGDDDRRLRRLHGQRIEHPGAMPHSNPSVEENSRFETGMTGQENKQG